MKQEILKFIRNEEGLTTVEYAIAGGLIGATVIGAFGLLGDEVEGVITSIKDALAAANPEPTPL
jgi:pilus assembly protein Flp/PilA